MSMTLGKIAELTAGELDGPADHAVTAVAGIQNAGPDQITLLSEKRFASHLADCNAAAVVTTRDMSVPDGLATIRVDQPDQAFDAIVDALHPEPAPSAGIHPTAVIALGVELDEDVSVGPHAVIDSGVRIGPRTRLGAGVHIGRDVRIGADCELHAHVVIGHETIMGDRVIVQNGSVIASDGFGWRPAKTGWQKIRQVGNVVIEDDVSIGALVTINRARMDSTRIRRSVKIDCNVHIAHNCDIGDGTAIAGNVGIAGSVKIGRGCLLAGAAGVSGHVDIGDGVILMAQAGATRSLSDGGKYVGFPAEPYREFIRRRAVGKKIPKLLARIEALEERAGELE